MRYRYKLAIQLAVFILPLFLLSSLLLWLNWQQQQYGQQFSKQLDKIAAAWQLEEGISKQVLALHRYATTGEPQYFQQMQKQQEQNRQLLENLQQIVRPTRQSLLTRLAAELQDYQQEAAQISERLATGDWPGARQILGSPAFQQREKTLLSLSSQLRELRWQDTRQLSREITLFGQNLLQRSAILIGSTILLSLLLAYYFHRQLVADNNRFKQILQTTRNVVITVNDRQVITSFNRIAEEIFQLPAARALGRKFSRVFTGRQSPGEIAFTYPLDQVMRSGRGRCNDERPYNAADGWPYTLRVDCLPLDRYQGRTLGAVLIMRDITEQKIVEEKLQGLAVRDSLTMLYNHRYLRRRLQQELARARQLRSRVAFLLMDIDNFKYYNDRFGHPAGDALLIGFARLLSSHLRQSDVLARYGGDEFAVILPDSDLKTAFEVAERLRNLVATYPFPHHLEMPEKLLSISVGIAIYPDDATEAAELVRLADEAMYAAKRSSKNRVEIYFSALREFQKELTDSDPQFINTARTLLTLINAKDRYTYAHSEQVARLSAMMAAAFNLPVQQQQDIRLAAFLHDLGKLDIPGDILNKAGPLTAGEWELIKQHPVRGADMISDFPRIRHLKPLILHHHERFDGSGYPEGLRGEQIPLGARIIAVADSYDAMTTQRPYKKALSSREAIAELQAGSGSQFDPQAVQVLIHVLNNLEQSYEALYSRQTG